MEFLQFGHDPWLVAISYVVALVAGATGLTLTRNLSQRSIPQKKTAVALAAVALGGGIWSMHFVAMLGLQLPILFYYDAAITLTSALIAILMVALALVLLHFTRRSRAVIVAAGAIVGAGVLAMHYVGMAGMQLCRAVYTPLGVAMSSALAVGLCVLAFAAAYGKRNNRSIALGTLCFGTAVFAVHFLAMANTRFVSLPEVTEFGPLISNEAMALGVILSSFAIFGAFIWVGSTYLGVPEPAAATPVAAPAAAAPAPTPPLAPVAPPATAQGAAPASPLSIPCEREGARILVRPADIAFVRADGHYTQVYTDDDRYFCVWPITEAGRRLLPKGFLKVHRSYVVNPAKVARFERTKDKGVCIFAAGSVPQAPVSRSRLKDVQAALAAQVVATRAG